MVRVSTDGRIAFNSAEKELIREANRMVEDMISPQHYKGAEMISSRDLQQAVAYIELARTDLSTQIAREYISNAIWWLENSVGKRPLPKPHYPEHLADGIESGRE